MKILELSSCKEKTTYLHTNSIHTFPNVFHFCDGLSSWNVPHHLLVLCGCLACLARKCSVWEFSWIWSEIRLVSPVCNKFFSAAKGSHYFSIKREWIGHVVKIE